MDAKAIIEAIELAKERNCWAVSDNVQITIDHKTGQVIVWNADGDYDARYAESEIDLILKEARQIEAFYTGKANK